MYDIEIYYLLDHNKDSWQKNQIEKLVRRISALVPQMQDAKIFECLSLLVSSLESQLMKVSKKYTFVKKGTYTHFKGKDYLVLGEVSNSETGESMVLYAQRYGNRLRLVRPFKNFFEHVDRQEYNYKGPRFKFKSR